MLSQVMKYEYQEIKFIPTTMKFNALEILN